MNKEHVREIVLSRIVVQDESTDRKKEVRVQRDVESTKKDDDYIKKVFFRANRLGDSQVI
jgi:hypothetical protein